MLWRLGVAGRRRGDAAWRARAGLAQAAADAAVGQSRAGAGALARTSGHHHVTELSRTYCEFLNAINRGNFV